GLTGPQHRTGAGRRINVQGSKWNHFFDGFRRACFKVQARHNGSLPVNSIRIWKQKVGNMTKRFRSVPWLSTFLLITILLTYVGISVVHRRDPARVYRIGWEEVYPFQVNGEIGQPTGFAVEVVREAARRRGIQLEWVKIRGSEASLRSGAVDLWP